MAAQKLGRATAGKRVHKLAAQFSQSLAVDEDKTFELIDIEFARSVAPMKTRVKAALAKVDGEPSRLTVSSPITSTLRNTHASAMARTDRLVVALAVIAHQKAEDAIRDELLVCEQTLSPTFEGTAEDAIGRMGRTRKSRIERHMSSYRKAVGTRSADFAGLVVQQYREAVNERTLLLRLFSIDPAGLRGFGGRGIWWQSVTEVRANVRAVSIGVANDARLDAMKAFNEVYDERV